MVLVHSNILSRLIKIFKMHLKTLTRDLITNFQVRKIESEMKRVKECNTAPRLLNIGMGTSPRTVHVPLCIIRGHRVEYEDKSLQFDILYEVLGSVDKV